jgi:internalin A
MSNEQVLIRLNQCRSFGGTSLSLLGLNLTRVPDEIREFKRLQGLNLGSNRLTSIPNWIGDFEDLQLLWLFENQIRDLPEEIGQLKQLERLWIPHNKLRTLPLSLRSLSKLIRLDLTHNEELGLPPEILSKSPQEILNYYFRLSSGKRRLNEAKMQLVGQGGVGKTSIVNRLVAGVFDEQQSKTEGINIHHIDIGTGSGDDRIRVNVWDFGGQEIMHATHQFFLSKRSLYLLVLDARAGEKEGNLHYWLEMIRIYGADSPALIVLNKCEEHFEELDETRIRLDYEKKVNLLGFHYISCKTDEGIEVLKAEVERIIRGMSHVCDLLPQDYFAVKHELEKQSVNTDFITEQEYVAVCLRHNITDQTEMIILLRFLHDLGCVLNYDDPEQVYQLRDTKVLNPQWVTGGVYKILNDPELLRRSDGVVSRSDLDRMLHVDDESRRRYPSHRFPFLIDMMRKFELCFDFPDQSGKVLVPELLSRNEPDVGWSAPDERGRDVLDFEFHYGILPRGLIPRFIVRSHHLLTAKQTYWRAGVVLQIEGCRVLVRGDLRTARVFIEVQGVSGGRRRALAVVRNYFDAIHLTYGSLEVEAKVPLPRDPQAPPVDYKYLQELEAEGVVEQRFEKARQKYRIRELLDGVDDRGYDLFLSHNSEDKPLVRRLRSLLERQGIRCWLDEDSLTPGELWQFELSEALSECRCIAVLIGPNGPSQWQALEAQLGTIRASSERRRLIPVLLPGVSKSAVDKEANYDLLRLRTWIDLSGGLSQKNIRRLVEAVRRPY